jgi:tight adherence protein C
MVATLLSVLLALAAGASVLLTVLGLVRAGEAPASLLPRAWRRLPGALDAGAPPWGGYEAELLLPLLDRTLRPLLRSLGRQLRRRLGEDRMAALRLRLSVAGHPWGFTAEGFAVARVVAAALVFAIAAGLSLLAAWRLLWLPTSLSALLAGAALALPGHHLPDLLLRGQADRRRARIQAQLPEILDMVAVTVGAGIGFDAAIVTVTERARRQQERSGDSPGALMEELLDAVRRYQLGRPLLESLRELADRVDLPDLSRLVVALEQAKRQGTALVETLAMQREDIRRRALERAEERAGRNSIVILVPMVLFIMPALLLVLTAPGALILLQGGGGAR